jgi:HSP20 family protein
MNRLSPMTLQNFFDVDRIMESMFSNKLAVNYPVMNVYSITKDDDNHIVYEVAVPGIDPKDIDIEVNDDKGVIRVQQSSEKEEVEENKNYYMKRIGTRKFDIGLHIPSTHELGDDGVSINHGILKIELKPKEKPDERIRKIEPKLIAS